MDDFISEINSRAIPYTSKNSCTCSKWELDLQITPEENLKAIKNALTKAGNKDFEVLEIPGLNHLFQTAKTGSPKEYEEIEETFSPKALEIMKNWIQKHQK